MLWILFWIQNFQLICSCYAFLTVGNDKKTNAMYISRKGDEKHINLIYIKIIDFSFHALEN